MRCFLVAASAAAFSSCVTSAWAQNLPPVATGTIPNLTARPTTGPTRVLGLRAKFRDPETEIVLNTTLGSIPVTLYADPRVATTVNNLLAYIDAGRYPATNFIHRSSRASTGQAVLQGGGFNFINNDPIAVQTFAAIPRQAVFSNVRGTIAMARGIAADSATSQYFLNIIDNLSLDTLLGGYAVFGKITTPAGLAVMDAIAALPTANAGDPFTELPVRNYSGTGVILSPNLIFAPITRGSARPLTGFSATSNATGIVTATSGPEFITLNFPGGTGMATVTANATDADGLTGGANAFTVEVSSNPPQANLANISTRGFVGTGDNVLIGGFVVRGAAKRVLIRSLGPSLSAFGITAPLANPNITLQSGADVIATNDDWKATQQADIQATGFAPTNDLESALIVTLQPGSYTPIVRGSGDSTGVAIIEVYELATNESPQLINISTRGRVGTGESAMIGGFVIGGTTPKRVIVRVAGPSLAQFGVSGVLSDPTLEINAGGRVIATNNDYQVLGDGSPNPDGPAILASGFQPADTRECAIIATFAPGSYTAIVRGVTDAVQGVAIVEVYDLD